MTPELLAATIKCEITKYLGSRVEMTYQNIKEMTLDDLLSANKTANLYTSAMADIANIIERIVKENAEKNDHE